MGMKFSGNLKQSAYPDFHPITKENYTYNTTNSTICLKLNGEYTALTTGLPNILGAVLPSKSIILLGLTKSNIPF